MEMNKIQQIREALINAGATYRARKTLGKNITETNVLINVLIEEVDAAFDALNDLEKEQAWQGIETAPRDGTAIVLLYRDLKKVSVGWWSGNEHVGWGNHFANNMNVSHWMNLPAPPEGE